MKLQHKNRQLQSGNLKAWKRSRAPRSDQPKSARPSLPRDFDDWIQSQREQLFKKVILSWHQRNIRTCDRGKSKMTREI